MTCSEESSLTVRMATEADSDLLFEWRNAPEVREWSFHKEAISPDTHAKWFLDALRSDWRHILIAEADGVPVGVVRLDCERTDAELHAYLGPGNTGKGWGGRAMDLACEWAT